MTELAADRTADDESERRADDAARRSAPRAQRKTAPIVPAQNIAGRALVLVIAIMTFLSCLTFGAVTLVRDTASVWENQISREATIQIKPVDGLDMEAALADGRADRQRDSPACRRPGSSTATPPRGCSSRGSARA